MNDSTEKLNPIAETLLGIPPEEPETELEGDDASEATLAEANNEPESLGSDESESEAPVTDMSVKQLAEKLEMTPKQLYQALKVDLGDNKDPMTLSELKNMGKDLRTANDKLEQVRKDQENYERQRLQDNRTYQLMQQKVGRQPSEAEVKEAEQLHQQWQAEQAESLLRVKPELADADTRAKVEEQTLNYLGKFGFTRVEMEQLLGEHRVFIALSQAADMDDRLAKASESVNKPKRRSQGRKRPFQPKRDADRIKSDYSEGRVDQNTAIAALLANGATGDGSI